MIQGIICIITNIISSVLFYTVIKIFSKDDTRIISKPYILYSSMISIIIVNIILCYIYKKSDQYIVFCTLNFYLTLTAYIDIHTMYVYRLINFIFGVLGLIFLIVFSPEVGSQLIGAMIYVVIVILITYSGGMGKGDAFTLMAIIPYMMFLNLKNDFLTIMLMDTVIYSFLFIIINIKKMNFRKMKLKSKSALTPAIAFGTLIIIIIEGFVKKGI